MKLPKIIMLTVFSAFLMVPNLWAVPLDGDGNVLTNTSGYTWNDSPYWSLTDLEGLNDSATFTLFFEEAAYESDFGIFTVDNFQDPASITKEFEIFDANEEPLILNRSVYFKEIGGVWNVSLDNKSWEAFGSKFGFYFGIHTSPSSSDPADLAPDYKFYSDWSFNTIDIDIQHIAIEYNGFENAKIYLDDQVNRGADRDWNDMGIAGTDIQPVPEPATMLLLGTGLIGLTIIGRKRFL